MSSQSPYDVESGELLRLIESDLKETNGVLARVVTSRDAVRPALVTILTAVVGFGLTQKDYRITLLAVPLITFAAFVEARHDALYVKTISRARVLEHGVERFVTLLVTQDSAQKAVIKADILDSGELYEYGINRSFRKSSKNDMWIAVNRRYSYAIYVILLVVAGGVALAQYVAADDDGGSTPVCFESFVPEEVDSSGDGVAMNASELRLIPCR